MNVLPECYADRVTSVFKSHEDFLKTRDDFIQDVKLELEKLAEKRQRSEIALQSRYYR
ncbi:MAG: hypothetical protein Q7R33_07900 [Nitrosarchaeum sp.]|nr:hypothetical protein [Nitrosarchaeum sp.]